MKLTRYAAEAFCQIALVLDALIDLPVRLLVSAERTAPALRLRQGGDPYRYDDDVLWPPDEPDDLDLDAWRESWRGWEETQSAIVWLTCPRLHVWEAWSDDVASHGTAYRPEWCPSCGVVGEVVLRDQQGGER